MLKKKLQSLLKTKLKHDPLIAITLGPKYFDLIKRLV
jgi:hypothetical protein